MKICCNRLGKHHCQALEDFDENDNERWFTDRNKHSAHAYNPESIMMPISLPKTSDVSVLSIDDNDDGVVEDAIEPLRNVSRNTLSPKYLMLRGWVNFYIVHFLIFKWKKKQKTYFWEVQLQIFEYVIKTFGDFSFYSYYSDVCSSRFKFHNINIVFIIFEHDQNFGEQKGSFRHYS